MDVDDFTELVGFSKRLDVDMNEEAVAATIIFIVQSVKLQQCVFGLN